MQIIVDYDPKLLDFIDLKSPVDRFIAVARIDDVYAGRSRVAFVEQKSLIEFSFTDNIWHTKNFYTVENAQEFIRTRLKTAVAKRNKMVTAFRIIELHISIIQVF